MECAPNKRTIALIVGNSMLLAAGILLIIFSCILNDNWWSLMMIFFFFFSVIFPGMCNAYRVEDNQDFVDSDRDEIGPMLGWFLVGVFIVMGYAIPLELLRKHILEMTGYWMSVGGGTVMLMAIILFIKILYY